MSLLFPSFAIYETVEFGAVTPHGKLQVCDTPYFSTSPCTNLIVEASQIDGQPCKCECSGAKGLRWSVTSRFVIKCIILVHPFFGVFWTIEPVHPKNVTSQTLFITTIGVKFLGRFIKHLSVSSLSACSLQCALLLFSILRNPYQDNKWQNTRLNFQNATVFCCNEWSQLS